jgi:signal transduction histidine kinase/CheY-like chemotaxis protein
MSIVDASGYAEAGNAIFPIAALSACAGFLLIGILAFAYLRISFGGALYSLIAFLGLAGFAYLVCEIGVVAAGYSGLPLAGMWFHRAQASVVAFFLLPLFVRNLVGMNPVSRRIMGVVTAIGAIACAAIVSLAFLVPDSLVSFVKEPLAESVRPWNIGRGTPGPLYAVREYLVGAISALCVGLLAKEIIQGSRQRHMFMALIGALVAICSGLLDLVIAAVERPVGLYTIRVFSWFGPGLTVFTLLSMIGALSWFIDRAKEIERARKLESLGVLAGGIAHDFNNLLTGVLGNASLLLESEGLSAEDRGLVEEIEAAGKRAKGLTGQLLAFARGNAPVRAVASLRDIVMETATFALRGSKVRLELEFPSELWNVYADTGQIAQVIQNLAINAKEAMPKGGKLFVKARNEVIGDSHHGLKPGRYVRLEVIDEGPGVAPELAGRVFDPYVSTKERGSGLGLAVCHSVMSKHEGSIELDSSAQGGAAFVLRFPATKDAVAAKSERGGQEMKFSGAALVMDDDDIVRAAAVKMLERLGLRCVEARDGAAAIEAYRSARLAGSSFALALLDLTVPGGMGGVECARSLKAEGASFPMIVSSGYSEGPGMANWAAEGFSGIVRKPYTYDEIRAAVACALD